VPGPTVRLTFAGDATDLERATARAGDALDGLEKGITAKGAAMAAAGAGLAAGLSAAFANSLDTEAAQAKFAAQLGGSEQYAAEMGAIAGRLYAGAYGENLGEVNEALRSVLQSGLLPEDAVDADIERVTGKVMSLAQAFDQDVQGSVNAVAQMIKTGLAPDAETAMDIITRGFQQGVDKSGDFLDTLNEYGTQFRKLGLDGVQATGLLSQGLQGGARDADLVADALKEFSIRAIDGSKAAGEAYKALGLDQAAMTAQIAKGGPEAAAGLDTVLDRLRAMTDPAAQSAAAVGLFGTQAEDLGQALYGLDLTTAADQLGDVAGAADRVNETLGETAAAKLESTKRGFEQWTNSIVGVQGPLGDVAAGVMAFGSDAIGIAGSVGMAALALRGFGIGAGIATAAQWLWNAALNANPIGIVVVAIAALVAGLIYAWNNSETFREIVIGAWDAVVGVVSGAVDLLGEALDWFGELPGNIGTWLADTATSIGDWLANLPTMIVDGLAIAGEAVLTFFTETLPMGIAFALGYLAGMIYNGALAAWDFLWNTLPGVIEQVLAWLVSLPGLAVEALAELGTYLLNVATAAWNLFVYSAITAGQMLFDFVLGIPGAVGGFLASLPATVGNAAQTAWDWFLNTTTSVGTSALNWIGELPGRVIGFFAGAGDWLVNAGKMILEGLWNGLKSIAQGVLDWISNIGAEIAAGFARATGIASPSKIFAEFGVNIGEGLIQGGEKVRPDVIDSYSGLSADVIATMDGATPSVGPAAGGGGGGGGSLVTFAGNVSDPLARLIMEMFRTGKIQITQAA
jgi:phage-related minor tail protein